MSNFRQSQPPTPIISVKDLSFRLKLLARQLPFPATSKLQGCKTCQSNTTQDTFHHFLRCTYTQSLFPSFLRIVHDTIQEHLNISGIRYTDSHNLLRILQLDGCIALTQPQGQGIALTSQIATLKEAYLLKHRDATSLLRIVQDTWLTHMYSHIWIPRCKYAAVLSPRQLINAPIAAEKAPIRPNQAMKPANIITKAHTAYIQHLQKFPRAITIRIPNRMITPSKRRADNHILAKRIRLLPPRAPD
jgi:hypothetical protein